METCSGDVVKVEVGRGGVSGQRGLGGDGTDSIDSWVASRGNAGECAFPIPINRKTSEARSNSIFERIVMNEEVFFKSNMPGRVTVDIRKNLCK